ncbi:glutamine-rich protein 2-like isoform X5 [Lytechinus variegatus]|uniref:glutamine-rich protein 2-like isoform X5 n=1 Tax=Lytechinus variegatus TaxID=7654 RepID=UPI001BB21CC2|nr:glutamine-rich protein 2-like isoform X5 [Lytechinus variegatus]
MATMTEINFAELIDLSLGTPEVVNYKGLRVLLAAIVSKLGVTSVNLELNEGDKKEINEVRDAQSKAKEHGTTPTRPSTGTGTGRLETNFTDIDKSKSIAITDSSRDGPVPSKDKVIQDIEQKMSKIEGQLSALNALPSNQSLMSRSGSSDDGTKKTPVSDMWQLMQCQKTAAANEEGVSKLMSMVEDIMRELSNMNQQLQDHTNNLSNLQDKHANLASDIEKINEYNKTVETRLSSLEASSGQQDKIDDLNKLIEELRNQLALLPQVEEIVTWPDFEAALKGAYKEPIDHSDSAMQTVPSEHSRVQTAPLNHASAQTTTPIPPTPSPPPSRPVSSRSMRSAVSSASLHPTQEIQRVLRELGELTGKHNSLEGRVQTLEDLMSKKADMSEVEALLSQWNVPGDLANKLAELEEGLNHLRDSKAKDNESFQKLQDALAQLQAEVDKLNTSYIHLVDEHNVKQKHIDALYTFVDRLQENKADKEHVIMEIDVKADKRALDNKVSRSHFDGAVDELSKNLSEVMDKLSGHKTAWDSAVGELKLDIDNKLDRMELDPLKSYLDNRIKSVSSKYVKKEVETGEDAAGFRKPLQKFHCISCDRPLDMAPQAPIASLPESRGLPSNRTGRPYTTFELEQIRAAQKKIALSIPPENDLPLIEGTQSLVPGELMRLRHTRQMTEYLRGCSPHVQRWRGAYQDVPDYFVASRSCGGSHTMTFPHRRITRVAQTTNMVTTTEDIAPVINGRIEADIQGQDGHIYKARLDTGHMTERLPTLTQPKGNMRAKSPRVSSARGRRSHPPSRQAPEPLDNTTLQPNGIPVPHSSTAARAPNRPTSGRPGSGNKPPSTSSGGRGSPVTAPANTEVEAGQPPPPTPRDAPPEAITVPQPPLEATSDQS